MHQSTPAVVSPSSPPDDHIQYFLYQILRGLKTLALRLERQCANAAQVAHWLAAQPAVTRVIYPGLATHPQHALARAQMDGFGAIVTFQIEGGREAANELVKRLRVFIFAESLGGVESLVCHPATMSHATMSEEEREKLGITEGTIRLSVGIEDERDLIDDLEQALEAARAELPRTPCAKG